MRRKAYLMMLTGLLPVGVAASISTGVTTAAAASTATAAGTHAVPAAVSIFMAGPSPQPLPQGCQRISRPRGHEASILCGWTDWLTEFYTLAKCRSLSGEFPATYWRQGAWARPTTVPGRYGTAVSTASCDEGDLVVDSEVVTGPIIT